MEDEYAACDVPFTVANRRCGTFYVQLVTIATNQQGWPHRLDRTISAHGDGKRVFQRFAGFLMEAAEDLVDWPAAGIVYLPAREFLGDRVYILDVAICIRRDDPVTNRLQCNLCAFLFAK